MIQEHLGSGDHSLSHSGARGSGVLVHIVHVNTLVFWSAPDAYFGGALAFGSVSAFAAGGGDAGGGIDAGPAFAAGSPSCQPCWFRFCCQRRAAD